MHCKTLIMLVALGIATLASVATGQERPASPRPVLLLFAHPDDEIVVAPLAANLARRGIPIVLALATAGENGAPPDGSITAGADLAAVRRDEARCSAIALGIAPPRFLGFIDGSLGEAVRPTRDRLASVASAVRALVDELHPRAVITWGPDGGYGHPDHRLVGAVASEVLLANRDAPPLLYVGLPADALSAHPPKAIAWVGVDRALLTISMPFTADDAEAARKAMQCHRSQFRTDSVVDAVLADLAPVVAGSIHLRPARPGTVDPFK